MLISPAKALEIYQVSKPTLYADMKSGKLSFSKDDRGKRKLDIAELERLYSKISKSNNHSDVKKSSPQTEVNVNVQNLEKELLNQKIQFLEDQVRNKDEMIVRWQDAFDKAQKTADKITLLIENHSNKNDDQSQKRIEELETKLQTLVEKEEARRKKIEERRRGMIEKQNQIELSTAIEHQKTKKGFWRKMIFNSD